MVARQRRGDARREGHGASGWLGARPIPPPNQLPRRRIKQMKRLLTAAAIVLIATTAHARPKVLGEMPKSFQGYWCPINSEDANSDYIRGKECQVMDMIRITPSGIDFHDADCRL